MGTVNRKSSPFISRTAKNSSADYKLTTINHAPPVEAAAACAVKPGNPADRTRHGPLRIACCNRISRFCAAFFGALGERVRSISRDEIEMRRSKRLIECLNIYCVRLLSRADDKGRVNDQLSCQLRPASRTPTENRKRLFRSGSTEPDLILFRDECVPPFSPSFIC